MTETKNNDERFPEVKPTKPGNDTAYIAPIIGKLGYDTRRPWLFGLGTSPNNGVDFHVFLSFDGLNFDDNDIDKIWNGGTADRVKKEVDSATAEIPAAVSAANSAVSAANSAVAASKVNSDAIVAQSEAISEAKSAMDSATAEIQQTAANAASDAAKIRADVAQVQSEVDTAKAANSASVEALKSDIGSAKKDLADVHDSLDKAQSAIEQNQKLINDSVAKITSDVSATKQDLATVHDSLTKAQAAAEQNQKAINDSIAEINANVDATNQDLAGVRKDLTKAQSDITANQKAIDDNVAQISDDITQDRKDIADVRQGLTKAQSDITANQKAVNDNVAQINSNIEQDRKDIASAQQANADTAKQLDTYSKQATEQGKTIKTIQNKQDGFTATLADVQGNVSQVSDKVDGLSASLKDTQGNVASVKSQADQLSATLTDHAKSIATLTASAKELSSTLEDADGRLSKVEQTAQTNSSTLSDVQGDLSQVKQNATKLVSTLKDAQGNISTLQQKADSLSTQLASAQGDIATLQTGVDSVKAILTSHDKSIHTLQADSKSLKDSMVNAQGDISTLRKTATDVTSELEDHTGRLSKVEQTASKQETTLSDLQGNLSQVEQKADSNTTTISSINKNAMQDRGVITDTNTSFDSLTHLGTYSIKATGLPKMPEQHYGTLAVSGSAGSGWISQQFVADTTGNVYTRVFSNNAWSAWKQGGSQDAINQVKQTADSNSATIKNVQGDVSTLKQTATGIKSTLASHEGDIHTLQADSKSLKDSMVNAQGDISMLQKSATSLDSEMKDHAGRLSKVEQNAATQATTLSDLQGNLSQVKQQADGLVTTLKNAQGSITQIQQKADGTLTQLKSAQGDIASLQTDVTGIKTTLVSHEGDIHTLQADSRMLKDDMKDAQGNISSLKKSATDLTSEMSSQDGRLSKVEQTAKEHTSTISDLGKKVDSNGGGVNLLTNTQLFDYNWAWDSIGHSFTNGVLTLDGNDDATSRMFQQLTDNDTTGKTFSVSFNARISADCDSTSVEVDAGPYDATKRINVTSKDFQHYKAENWQWNSSSMFFSLYVKSGKIDITNLKLEYGAVATPYSLAPADLATISQVKQTADGIETTLKSAQGDIDQIKQTAKGTSEQLADVKGNVTNIQKDVNGLKQTTADNAGNIHTLQSDSKALQDDMKDAKGNISSLQKTSTSLVSEFRDHDGRLSKVEQTATEHTSELADTKGNIDKVTQKANTLQLLLSDAQKNINDIKIDAQGLHQTLTGQSNQLASLNVTLNNLDSKYSGITGDLQSKQTALSTEQQQTKDLLLRKADKSEVDNVKGTVNQVSAKQKVMADQISQKVSSVEYQTLKDKVNGLRIGGRNLLSNSDKDIVIESKTTDPYPAWDNKVVYWDLTPGETYTFSVSATNTNGVEQASVRIFKESLDGKFINKEAAHWYLNADGKRHSFTFTTPNNDIHYDIWLYAGPMGKLQGKDFATTYHHPQLELGNIESDYSLNPDDIITAIQKNSTAIDQTNSKISLKADQTEVDNVKNTAQQISSRLDILAGEVKSKVDETRVNNIVDGKGYATTSTVQSLVDQKAGTLSDTITELDRKIGDNHSDSIKRIQSLTASIDGLQSRVTNYQNDTSSKYTQLSNLMQSKVGTADFEQLKRSVDMQTLDSADINNMKTNGHYFVHNLANNPIGGWVYVDVTGDGKYRIRQDVYQDSWNKHKFRSWYGDHWTNWEEGATYSEITQLQDAINLRVQKGELLSQINLTAGNTLIQSNKLYLDASSVVITGTAFIPSAAIASLSADKVNTGWLNTNNVNLGDGRTRIIADHDYMYIQPTGSAASNTGIRMGYSGLDFLTNVIPNGYSSSVPYYSVGYDGAANGYFKISAFDHINPGGTTATQNWFTMYDAISLNNKEVNIAANNKPRIRVTDNGIEVRPTIFFNNENYSGTWAGFTRLDNKDVVEFNTGNNDGENFHVNSGARFMKYVYFNDYCRAQGWLTYSTLSKKTNIKKLDTSLALDKIRQDDQYLYEYKRNVAKGVYDPQASFIIDDVNDVSHYSVPREFIDQTGKYREPSVELSYLIAAFQEIDKQVQLQKEEIKELKEKLQHE
ncbi:hypothetical protein DN439_03970 [Lactobacillus reuteri]|uniref:hypothetical protein n=2 Tax=Limosilactobacillus reuteri TaxID=1598 RepID=UPI00128C54CC|nr:hypothetical protein [Limosilactobacillus reuteri]MQB72799.1 hypothetical protein [Limosilactobacillus reuteri]